VLTDPSGKDDVTTTLDSPSTVSRREALDALPPSFFVALLSGFGEHDS
jgi:hypothetical protein